MEAILNRLRNYVVYIIYAIVCLSVLVFFGRNFFLTQEKIEGFKRIAVNGRLIQLEDLQRGTSQISIQRGDSIVSVGSLRINWGVKKYDIQVGDSVSKNANSDTLRFYKLENGVYKKCCDITF